MKRKIFNVWFRHKTKNLTQIPIFTIIFDYRKYQRTGKPGSCTVFAHPDIAKDEFVKERLGERARSIPETGGPDTVECTAIENFHKEFQTCDRELLNICKTNPDCEHAPGECGYAINCTSIEDSAKRENKYVCGAEPCKYESEREK